MIERGMTEEQMNAFWSSKNEWYDNPNCYYFFWDPTKNKDTEFSGYLPPYTLLKENGKNKGVINNEIFKMVCLGVGEYDSSKSPYWNYQNNQIALTEFDSKYEIHLSVKTPNELTEEDIKSADYIHFDSGNKNGDIENFSLIYNTILDRNGNPSFEEYSINTCDITFGQAKEIYQRAMSGNLSVALPGEKLWSKASNSNFNLFKLQMMFNFFDDPSQFNELFEPGGRNGFYINENGELYKDGQYKSQWSIENLSEGLEPDEGGYITSFPGHNDGTGNYIPPIQDNILIYDMNDVSSHGFLSKGFLPFNKIEIILDGKIESGGIPDNPEDASVHVLEIQPCNSYKFQTIEAVNCWQSTSMATNRMRSIFILPM
ncbi:hypothetical protein [Clostridium sp. AM58-1XD]|uniref:hypothetical protein n=1 Tax=Clostridium sp. AM58-1XD TaxID=2292307 RepID=UPI0015F54428|nr:hypothetical protein [Clostridium sp. AM58-1XD]